MTDMIRKSDVQSALRDYLATENSIIAQEVESILAALTPTAVDASQATDPVVNAPDPAAIREAALREALEIAMACERQNYARVTDSGHHSHYRAGLRSAGQAISAAIKSRIAKGAAE